MKYQVICNQITHGDEEGNFTNHHRGDVIDFGDKKPSENLILHGLLKAIEDSKEEAKPAEKPVEKPAEVKTK